MKGKIKKLWARDEVEPTCKMCGTALKTGQSTCSLCGHVVGAESNVFYIRGDAGGTGKKKDAQVAAPPSRQEDVAHAGPVDEAEPEIGSDAAFEEVGAMEVLERFEEAVPTLALDPPGLRLLLAEQPELLEPGLRIASDKNGKPVGAGLSTAVGTIDLLARDGRGAFVVVTVGGREPGEKLVSEALQRVGWVRKHLSKGKVPVRALILVEEAPANLSYAAAAVADTIRFKTYRVGLSVEDLEL